MEERCNTRIRVDGEEISITDIKSSGYCFLSEKESVFQRS